MVKYISQYNALISTTHSLDSYRNASNDEKRQIDEWLNGEEVRKCFGSRIVPQLTVHESFVLGFLHYMAMQGRTDEEQRMAINYLNSKNSKSIFDSLEMDINLLEKNVRRLSL